MQTMLIYAASLGACALCAVTLAGQSDDAPWHFVDASGATVTVVGLRPGLHAALIELAGPTRKVIASETVTFTVPDTGAEKK